MKEISFKLRLLSYILFLLPAFYIQKINKFNTLIPKTYSKDHDTDCIKIAGNISYLTLKIFNILNIRSCFTRSIVLRNILKRYDIHAKLIIGIKSGFNGFSSHCWLTINDNFFTEKSEEIEQYKILGEY